MNQTEFNAFTDTLGNAVSAALEQWMRSHPYPLPEEMVAALIQIAHKELLYMIDLVPTEHLPVSTALERR